MSSSSCSSTGWTRPTAVLLVSSFYPHSTTGTIRVLVRKPLPTSGTHGSRFGFNETCSQTHAACGFLTCHVHPLQKHRTFCARSIYFLVEVQSRDKSEPLVRLLE